MKETKLEIKRTYLKNFVKILDAYSNAKCIFLIPKLKQCYTERKFI